MAGSIKVLLTISRSHGLPSESWPEPTIFWPEVARAVTPGDAAKSQAATEDWCGEGVPPERVRRALAEAEQSAKTVAWAADELGYTIPPGLGVCDSVAAIVGMVRAERVTAKEALTRALADARSFTSTATWAAKELGCGVADDLAPDVKLEAIVEAVQRERADLAEYRSRSRILAAIEGMLGCGHDKPITDVKLAQAMLRHHVGTSVLANLSSAVSAEDETLESIELAIARLVKYGRYRDPGGIPLEPGRVVSTPTGDTMRVERVLLTDADGEEVRDARDGLTWAAAGTVLTGFGGARSVVVQGPLTVVGRA